jgi:hypothetical protein
MNNETYKPHNSLSRSALNKFNEFVLPQNALKTDIFTCPTCTNQVILAKGKIIQPYFRHKVNSNCERFCKMTAEHLDAQILLKQILEERLKPIEVSRNCLKCTKIFAFEPLLLAKNCRVELEHSFKHKGHTRIADVASINEKYL